MVRSMKRALSSIGNSAILNENEFRTLLMKAADLLNSRPLSSKISDPLDPLTPNHFLIPGYLGVPTDLLTLPEYRYTQLQRIVKDLWARFTEEVVLDNRNRSKWTEETPNLVIDQIVLILDPKSTEKTWVVGVVRTVTEGPDGRVRSALIQTRTGEYHRTVPFIIPLPPGNPMEGGLRERKVTDMEKPNPEAPAEEGPENGPAPEAGLNGKLPAEGNIQVKERSDVRTASEVEHVAPPKTGNIPSQDEAQGIPEPVIDSVDPHPPALGVEHMAPPNEGAPQNQGLLEPVIEPVELPEPARIQLPEPARDPAEPPRVHGRNLRAKKDRTPLRYKD